MDLGGRHALVTGGGRGIGLAVATALAKAGARVSIIGRDAARLDAAVKAGAAHAFRVADVTDEAATLAALEALAASQPFDIVVANAGGAETAPFTRSDAALFRRMFDLNVIGAATAFRAALPGMINRRSGRLIAIASTAGLRGYAYASAYSAAKHGVIGLVKSLALEVASSGVTVNAICPGYTDTDLVIAGARGIAAKTGVSLEDAKARFAADNPMGRLIRPEEIAAMALYLCGPGTESLSGQALMINGGEF
jgi:NAD(P)-dependent dehydrogenase (short-subunit alcohol dehydrogenase family)